MGLTSIFAYRFPILINVLHQLWVGNPWHTQEGWGWFREPQASAPDKTFSALGTQGPDLIYAQRFTFLGFHKDLEGSGFPTHFQHESPFENQKLIWKNQKLFMRFPHDRSYTFSIL